MEKAVIYREKEEFTEAHWVVKNATANQYYEFTFETGDFPNIQILNIRNIESSGLSFKENTISGMAGAPGVYPLEVEFCHRNDQSSVAVKNVRLFVNADPKDLWKNIPANPGAGFYKPDEASFKGGFLDKKLVAVSKRGRAHAHEGKFREDDFKVDLLPAGWAIVSVSDGAGSAIASREGSRLAVTSVNEFFSTPEIIREIDKNIISLHTSEYPDTRNESRQHLLHLLHKGMRYVYEVLEKTAGMHNFSIGDLHTTLVFVLAKKFSFGYGIISFGVGDSPAGLISKDFSEVTLLNVMDVGEFSGGTRFITMKEIFNAGIFSRFKITFVEDFSHLILMTDGIYDPKFMTENKLGEAESWKLFFSDLDGNNEEQVKVDFIKDHHIQQQLLTWTDFWSRGNHDDRTLAIIY